MQLLKVARDKYVRMAVDGRTYKYYIKISKNKPDLFEIVVIFTESALRPIQSLSRDVRLFVCLCVRHTLETTLPEGLESSGRMAYR